MDRQAPALPSTVPRYLHAEKTKTCVYRELLSKEVTIDLALVIPLT